MDSIVEQRPKPRRPTPADVERKVKGALAEPHRVLFLDVETTGLSRYYDHVTVVGWNLGGLYQANLATDPPDDLAQAISKATTLVTFNGTLFDVPFLRKTFPSLSMPQVHLDLRYLARRVGLVGGQKNIEQILGIDLRKGFGDVDGRVAVLLWHRYLRGDEAALRQLIRYNRADVLSMRYILDHVVERLNFERDLFFSSQRFASQAVRSKGYARALAQLPQPPAELGRIYDFSSLFKNAGAANARTVGIDLTGSERRPSGWCLLDGRVATTCLVNADSDIVAKTIAARPALISIDSPLSLPFGRNHVRDDDPARQQFGIMRRCERELKRRGINVYPCLLPSMQRLTERGIRLATEFRRRGIPTIECYPGAAQDILRIPRKGAGLELLTSGLTEFGLLGAFADNAISHDELDAITCALVGHFFLAGRFEALTGPSEGELIIPDVGAQQTKLAVGISGRIAAGKTTVARIIEAKGFAYTRFSLVVDEEIRSRGKIPNRELRQREGLRIHNEYGQRWLAERALRRVEQNDRVIVDGLRFPEDHAYFVERYGTNFLHIHVTASREVRQARYALKGDGEIEFSIADAQPVEASIDDLASLAHVLVTNAGSLDDLRTTVDAIVAPVERDQCLCL